MSAEQPLSLCTIAGSDPTGGAGLQGDLKTFAAHRAVGTAVVTAVTVQGRHGVARVEPVSPALVAEQLAVVLAEVRPAGLKTGMLWSAGTIAAVADALADRGGAALVVDPVLVATAGGSLLQPEALPALLERLLPLADLVTPNLPEAAQLLGRPVIEPGAMEDAALALLDLGPAAVLLKGGHGTGCALAASLAARLARGEPLARAVEGAKDYVWRALGSAAARGPGSPLDHSVAADPPEAGRP
jgi:hydroxymethylpyrimidine/phosphomethylpyrimidine kinase